MLTYTCPEAPAAQRFLAVVIHDNGERAPVIFLAPEAEVAGHNAEAWYASELERVAKQSAPRKPRAKKAEAVSEQHIFDDDMEEII